MDDSYAAVEFLRSCYGIHFPTGRVVATDSVIFATSGYVVPADYDISPGFKDLSRAKTYTSLAFDAIGWDVRMEDTFPMACNFDVESCSNSRESHEVGFVNQHVFLVVVF
ncbi:hypothetical protein Tco_0124675 [Tanacetum coccineum]